MDARLKNGKLEGILKTYYDGKLSMELPYKNGKKNGIAKHYDRNGKLIKQVKYEDDKEVK